MLHRLSQRALLLAAAATAATLGYAPAADAATCGTEGPVTVAEMTWGSASLLAHLHALILEHGYGCEAEVIAGDTVPTSATLLARGEPSLTPELWTNLTGKVWGQIEAAGKARKVGESFVGGGYDGFFIPTYVAEQHPDLQAIKDLPKFAEVFASDDTDGKGKLIGCPPGWGCEILTINQYRANGLTDTFEVFNPGSAGAMDAEILRHYTRQEPVLFYYWGPTALMGRLDVKALDAGPVDEHAYACLSEPDCPDPKPSAFLPQPTIIAAGESFAASASPEVLEYLGKATVPIEVMNSALAWGDENKADGRATAIHVLKTREDVWTQWVPADVAESIRTAVAGL